MNKKVLVTYATKLGSTRDVAQTVGETITQKGASVYVQPVNEVSNISEYDAVVLGSAIRMGQWLPEAMNFSKTHQAKLNTLPTAIFTVHILNTESNPESIKARQTYTAPVWEILSPKSEAFFAGKIDLEELNFFERLLFRAVKSPAGDLRDWNAIRTWAGSLEL